MDSLLLALSRWFSRLPARMVRRRWMVLLTVSVLTVLMAWGAVTRTRLDMSLDSFIDQQDPAIQALNSFRSQFGSDDSVYLVYEALDGDAFSAASLRVVKALTERLQDPAALDGSDYPASIDGIPVDLDELSHIRRVESPVTLRVQSSTGDTLLSQRLVPETIPTDPAGLARIRERAMAEEDYVPAFYSRDGRFGALRIQTTFGAEPADSFEPAINDASITLSDSFAFPGDGATDPLAFSADAIVQDIPFQTVDMADYSRFFTALRAVYTDFGEALAFHPVGNPPLMDWVYRMLQDMLWLAAAMVAVFVLLLWSLFRSLSAVAWPMAIVSLSLLWAWGLTSWAGLTLSTMVNLTVMLIFAVGLADCIHVMSAYLSSRRAGQDHDGALTEAYDRTGLAILVTTLTTMSGVLALTWSDLLPIRVFAVMSALGVGVAFLLTVVLLPVLLSFWHPDGRDRRPAPLRSAWPPGRLRSVTAVLTTALVALLVWWTGSLLPAYALLVLSLLWMARHWQDKLLLACPAIVARSPYTVLALFLAIFLVSLYGTSQVRIDSNVAELTREGSEPHEAYDVVDRHMAGAQNIAIMIDTGRSDGMTDPAILTAVDELQRRIERRYPEQVSRTYSLANIVKDTHQVMRDDDPAFHRIPDSAAMITQLLYLFNSANPEERRSLVSDDYSRSHITINAYNAGSYQYRVFFRELRDEIDAVFGGLRDVEPAPQVTVTGSIPLMMRAMDEIAQSQYRSLLLALAVISLIMIVTLGSLQAGLIAMIPNLIPALLTFGLMGLLSIPLDTDTLLIAPVIIGIAVDDTIHFMTHYRVELLRSRNMEVALRATVQTVGKAVMFTTMILGLGFALLGFSDYLGIARIGVFGSLAVFVALLCDLLLLPAMIMIFKPRFGIKGLQRDFQMTGAMT